MRRFSLTACPLILLLACGGPTEPEAAPSEQGSGDEEVAGADNAPEEQPPHLRNCVLHTGGGRGRPGPDGAPTGECDFDAECIAEHGAVTTQTDGFIYLSCQNAECECRVTRAVNEGEEEPEPFVSGFTAPEVCATASAARALFLEHCMVGSELATE